MEEWRTYLYPLGFIASIPFAIRFIIQWLESEKKQRSIISPLFWQLSLIGNILLLAHSLIQLQFHISFIQTCNAVISWRNLNLLQTLKKPLSLIKVIFIMAGSLLAVASFYGFQNMWFRNPIAPWQQDIIPSLDSWTWHAFGTLSFTLFSLRFWIQWIWVEEGLTKTKNTFSAPLDRLKEFPLLFWWLSIGGSLLSIIYCLHIHDTVNLIGPVVGIIPYIRNLMLISKTKEKTQEV